MKAALFAAVAGLAAVADASPSPALARLASPSLAEVGAEAGAYPAVAKRVAQMIVDDLPAFNAYAKEHRISNGGKTKIDGTVSETPFQLKDLFAIAGTASNLLGCRSEVGHDFDFWSSGDVYKDGKHLLRLEFTPATVSDGPKDNYWMEYTNYKGQAKGAASATQPWKYTKGHVLHINEGVTNDDDKSWITTSKEFDIWSQKANLIDGKETGTIRKDVKKTGATPLSFALRGGSENLYILPIQYLIRQKVGLVRNKGRQLKQEDDADVGHLAGAAKMKNDAGDLSCMCAHSKGSAAQLAHDDIKKICAYKWGDVQTAVAQLIDTNEWAGVAKAAAKKKVAIHQLPKGNNDHVDTIVDAMAGVADLV